MYPTAFKDPRGGHNRSQINHQFFQSWSPQMAYILGFIFADGAIEDVQKSSRTCYIAMVSKDLSLLQQIRMTLSSTHTIYKRIPKLFTYPNGKQYLADEIFYLRIGSKLMYNDLLKLGVTPRKSLTIAFPKIPKNYLSYFLRGYFDGDGCVYLKNRSFPSVVFSSGSLIFLQSLNQVISINLDTPIISINTDNSHINQYYQLRYNKLLSSKILEFMYKDLDKAPYLERKFEIYQRYLKQKAA